MILCIIVLALNLRQQTVDDRRLDLRTIIVSMPDARMNRNPDVPGNRRRFRRRRRCGRKLFRFKANHYGYGSRVNGLSYELQSDYRRSM